MTYSRNFEFRVPPRSGERAGRFYVDAATVIGAPVYVDLATPGADADGSLLVNVATTGDVDPAENPELAGIAVYEELFTNYEGESYSDKTTAPANARVQVVSGKTVKVAFRNTTDTTMVAPANLSGITVGTYLVPDDAGTTAYWEAVDAASTDEAWLIVTDVDAAAGTVEAQLVF